MPKKKPPWHRYVVLVCGGRDYDNAGYIFTKLDKYHAKYSFTLVVTGGATGVDSIADRWAESRGIDRVIYPANWKGQGKAAGFKRNVRMRERENPNMIAAFPGGAGTDMMVKLGREWKIKCVRFKGG